MELDIIHVGEVCRFCAEEWLNTYQDQMRKDGRVVVTCYEPTPEDCEDCEGDAAPIHRGFCTCGCSRAFGAFDES